MAVRMVFRTRSNKPWTASGCDAMYSSTDLKSVLAIVIPVFWFSGALSALNEQQGTGDYLTGKCFWGCAVQAGPLTGTGRQSLISSVVSMWPAHSAYHCLAGR